MLRLYSSNIDARYDHNKQVKLVQKQKMENMVKSIHHYQNHDGHYQQPHGVHLVVDQVEVALRSVDEEKIADLSVGQTKIHR